jgi:hypothetical protein
MREGTGVTDSFFIGRATIKATSLSILT